MNECPVEQADDGALFRAFLARARAARMAGDKKNEETFWKKALDQQPENIDFKLLFARSLFEQDRHVESMRLLQEVMEEKPDSADAHFFAGIIQYKEGRFNAARNLFERALNLDPDHPSRKIMEQKIKEMGEK